MAPGPVANSDNLGKYFLYNNCTLSVIRIASMRQF